MHWRTRSHATPPAGVVQRLLHESIASHRGVAHKPLNHRGRPGGVEELMVTVRRAMSRGESPQDRSRASFSGSMRRRHAQCETAAKAVPSANGWACPTRVRHQPFPLLKWLHGMDPECTLNATTLESRLELGISAGSGGDADFAPIPKVASART